MDKSTLFAVIDMITSRYKNLIEEQKDPETAYPMDEFFSVKSELKNLLKKLWVEVNKIDKTSTKVVGNIEQCFKEEEFKDMEEDEENYFNWD